MKLKWGETNWGYFHRSGDFAIDVDDEGFAIFWFGLKQVINVQMPKMKAEKVRDAVEEALDELV